jgi:hypothetical protein
MRFLTIGLSVVAAVNLLLAGIFWLQLGAGLGVAGKETSRVVELLLVYSQTNWEELERDSREPWPRQAHGIAVKALRPAESILGPLAGRVPMVLIANAIVLGLAAMVSLRASKRSRRQVLTS